MRSPDIKDFVPFCLYFGLLGLLLLCTLAAIDQGAQQRTAATALRTGQQGVVVTEKCYD